MIRSPVDEHKFIVSTQNTKRTEFFLFALRFCRAFPGDNPEIEQMAKVQIFQCTDSPCRMLPGFYDLA